MTEYELVLAAGSYNALVHSWIATYFAAYFAYLLVAYLAGDKFTPSQARIVSVSFVVFSALSTYAAAAAATRTIEFIRQAQELNPGRESAMTTEVLWVTATILLLGILVALKFMWDVRHPKQ